MQIEDLKNQNEEKEIEVKVKNREFIELCKTLNYDPEYFVSSLNSIESHLRLNRLFIDEEKFIKLSKLVENIKLERIKWLDFPVYKIVEGNVGKTFLQKFGYIFIQSLSSMLVPVLLKPNENDLVLDMCAAPGAKTTLCADLMNNKGCIIALEKYKNRMVSLVSNLSRFGIINTIALNEDALNFKYDKKFDKIILDPPCTSLGTYNGFKSFSFKRMKKQSNKQKKLIEKATKLLKDDGILSYSTCTLSLEENEEVIEFAVKELGMKVENKLPYDIPNLTKGFDNLGYRILPWKFKSEGFYIAHLKKE